LPGESGELPTSSAGDHGQQGSYACYDSYDGYGYDSSVEVSAEAKPGAAAAAGQVGSTI